MRWLSTGSFFNRPIRTEKGSSSPSFCSKLLRHLSLMTVDGFPLFQFPKGFPFPASFSGFFQFSGYARFLWIFPQVWSQVGCFPQSIPNKIPGKDLRLFDTLSTHFRLFIHAKYLHLATTSEEIYIEPPSSKDLSDFGSLYIVRHNAILPQSWNWHTNDWTTQQSQTDWLSCLFCQIWSHKYNDQQMELLAYPLPNPT